jgi:hypothetical protein
MSDVSSASARRALPQRAVANLYAPRRFSKRSRQRFTANRTTELVRHLGRAPNYPERLLIARVCSLEYWILKTDARMDAGEELSGHAMRARLAAETRLRLDLRELGLKGASAQPPSLAEALAAGRTP